MIFTSFLDRPPNIAFSEQEPDEHIELLLRQHGVTNLGWILASLIGYIVPILAIKLSPSIGFNPNSQIPSPLLMSGLILWYMGLLTFIFTNFLTWYFNIYIITNKHLVDISLDYLLFNSVTSTEISDIQSTRYQFKGILASIFRYGTVQLETAAKDQTIDFISVPHPDLVVDRIEDLQGGKVGKSL